MSSVGGHLPSETIGFVSALQDVEDERPPLPMGVISPDCEPKWRTTVARWFGR